MKKFIEPLAQHKLDVSRRLTTITRILLSTSGRHSVDSLMKKIEWLFLLAASALVLMGCGPSAEVLHLHSDPALTLKHIEKGRVAVLPALSTTPLMDAEALARVRGQLAGGISRVRPTITQTEEARIDSSLRERPQLKPALQRYAGTLAISREDLQQIGAATGARYVVFTVFNEFSFGWGEPPVIEYRKQDPTGLAEKLAKLADAVANPGVPVSLPVAAAGSMVAAGLLIMADSDPSRRLQPQPTMARVTGRAYAQIAGTLSVFDALDGRAVWVGAAAVKDSVEESASVELNGRKLSSADVPAPEPPALAMLSSRFFDVLLNLWPQ